MPEHPPKARTKFAPMTGADKAAFAARLAKFEPRWTLMPASYQIRNPDGSPGGWVAQVRLIENRSDAMVIRPLTQRDIVLYETRDQANSIAGLLGLNWLESNASPKTSE